MAYWNEIYELVRKVDDENLNIYVYIYPYDGNEEEGEILVFDNNESVEKFNSLLRERLKDIPEVIQAKEDAIYDVDNRDDWYIDLATEDNWTYSCEGFTCSECEKWKFYNERNACGYANYKIYDGYIMCDDCILSCEETKEKYVKDFIDNPNNANTILGREDIYELGFEKVNDYAFANGMYQGENDNPKKILAKAKEMFPDCEFIFSIVKDYNPYHTEFDLYKREIER